MRAGDNLRLDWAFGWRSLRRNPGFAAIVLLTLSLGIGAATGMFSVVQAVWLRPLPYREPDRLVAVWSDLPRVGVQESPSAYSNIDDWRKSGRTLDGVAAYDGTSVVLTDAGGEAQRVSASLSSPELFAVLGVTPELGRGFTLADMERRESLAVISHSMWVRRFGGDPAVVGHRLVINGRPAEIIGVMPAGFYFPDKQTELWLPLSFKDDWETARGLRGLDSWRVVARLAPGAFPASAQAELTGIATTLEKSFPADNAGLGVRIVPLSLQVTGRSLRIALFLLTGAVSAVLLIACSNVGNLLLVRGSVRQREFAVREALGASRGRVVRQLLAESTILALLAAGLGAVLAESTLHFLRTLGPALVPRLDEATLDAGAFAFAAVLSLASALLFGLLSALASTRHSPMDILRGAGRGLTAGASSRRLRATLVVGELAFAVVLLVTTAAFLRSLARLAAVDTGFQAADLLVIGASLPPDRPEKDSIPYARAVLERVRALPGVAAAAFIEDVLLGDTNVRAKEISIEEAAGGSPNVIRLPVSLDTITPDYFRAAGVALKAGRFFNDQDGPDSTRVVIVNETLARRLWPGANPIGRRLRQGGPAARDSWAVVAGVVADLRRQGSEHAPVAQAFWPLAQHPSRALTLVVSANVDPSRLATAVRAAIVELDRSVPVATSTTLHRQLRARQAGREFNLGLLAAFAVIALALAGVGLFGLMSYAVTQRSREIGIRLALGAQPNALVRLIVGEGMRLALLGIALGGVAAALVLHRLAGLLYETSTMDPVSFAAGSIVLFGVALVACYLPARRVLSVNPVAALQAE